MTVASAGIGVEAWVVLCVLKTFTEAIRLVISSQDFDVVDNDHDGWRHGAVLVAEGGRGRLGHF